MAKLDWVLALWLKPSGRVTASRKLAGLAGQTGSTLPKSPSGEVHLLWSRALNCRGIVEPVR
jgi:hypothetical protein